jgi:hypothetical protein
MIPKPPLFERKIYIPENVQKSTLKDENMYIRWEVRKYPDF